MTIEEDVEWYFTDPLAPWVGKSNIFNARTWYGGVIGWPELGEVEDAPRTWSRGNNRPIQNTGVHGSDDQWIDGAYTSDALSAPPCGTPVFGVPFPENGGEVFAEPGHVDIGPLVRATSDRYSLAVLVYGGGTPDAFLTVDRMPGPICGFPSRPNYYMSVGPPTFDPHPLASVFGIDLFPDCLNTVVRASDGLGGLPNFTIALNPP